MEFIGEDWISHTSRDEKVLLYIGDAFDIVGERKQTSFTKIDKNTIKEEFEIKIRNHKKEDVTVKVLEKLYRGANGGFSTTPSRWTRSTAALSFFRCACLRIKRLW